jgi:hypothetical protein
MEESIMIWTLASVSNCTRRARASARWVLLLGFAALGAIACGDGEAMLPDSVEKVDRVRQFDTHADEFSDSCGYELSHGTYSVWPGGYQAYGFLKNVSGKTGVAFEVLMDIGETTLANGWQAEYEVVEDGLVINEPSWLKWQQIPRGRSYQFGFIGQGAYAGAEAWVISVNGEL